MTKYLYIFNKIKPENLFITLAFFFGLIFSLITPIFEVPDEAMHLLRACEVANLVIHNNKNGDISKDILPYRKILLKRNCSNFQEFKDKKHYTDLFEFKSLNYTHNNTGYPFFLYLPSAIGIKICSYITSNPYVQFYAGRFVNLISWIFLTFIAIKITPRFKWAFFVTALFPMTIYEGMSLSADSINLGFAFLYIAYTFHLAYGESPISKKEKILFVALTLLTVLTKGLFLLTLLTLLIPKNKVKNKFLLTFSLISTVFILQSIISSHSFIFTANNVDIETRKEILLKNPLFVIQLIANTLIDKTTFYIQSSIFRLGWLEIEPNNIAVLSLFFCFILSVTLEKCKFKIFDKVISVSICIAYALLTIILYYLTFSPLENSIIIGIQGRYFISLYPLFAITLHGFLKLPQKKILYNIKPLILLTVILNLIYACYLIKIHT